MQNLNAKNETRKRLIIIIVISSLIILTLAFTAKNKFSTKTISTANYSTNAIYNDFNDDNVSSEAIDYGNAIGDTINTKPSKTVKTLKRSKPKAIVPPLNETNEQIQNESIEKYIIKNGNLSIKVFSLSESIKTISEIARSNGGDILSTNINPQSNYGFLTMQVNVDKFEHALNSIKDISSVVENESISTSDATRQVIDLKATIKNKKAQEDRLRNFFERAENVEDLLAIERNLTTVRGEIEIIEARLKSTLNQTSFSKITVNIIEDVEILPSKNDWRPSQVAKNSINSLIKKIQNIINSAIDISISSLPIFILSLLGLWIMYLISKKLFSFIIKKTTNKNDNAL